MNSPRTTFVVIITAILVSVAFVGWSDFFQRYLEMRPPQIQLLETPRGLGAIPTQIRFKVSDPDSGLSHLAVREQQGQISKVLVDEKNLNGIPSRELVVNLLGRASNFEQGNASLIIDASDRSLWKNGKTQSIDFSVDYTSPTMKVVAFSEPVQGGSGLVIYRVNEEDLYETGVRVGRAFFSGYPARFLDSEFSKEPLFISLYTIPLDADVSNLSVEIVGEDKVGNGVSIPLGIERKARTISGISTEVNEGEVQEEYNRLYNQNLIKLQGFALDTGKQLSFISPKGSIERSVEEFAQIQTILRTINLAELRLNLNEYRFDRQWKEPLSKPAGISTWDFASKRNYFFRGERVCDVISTGTTYRLPRGASEIVATAKGVVLFADNFGIFGRVIALDHGLGLVSLYTNMDRLNAKKGDLVDKGDSLGTASPAGEEGRYEYSFELRVGGYSVDVNEWTDSAWFFQNIQKVINETKRNLEIPLGREDH